MLVLARKSQEAVVISSSNGYEQVLKVTVLQIRGGTVKLGFEAGAEVPIHRAEVWEKIRSESRSTDPKPIGARPKYKVPYLD
jgi:carbon storage regulator